MRAKLAALTFLAAVLPASAASFTAERLTDGRVAIHMRGVIEYGDEAKAEAARRTWPTASLFLLDSPGGNVFSSVEIGRRNPLPAQVRTGEECASGCAMIWASAPHRYIEPNGSVGFHRVSRVVDGREEPDPRMNAEVAAYYGRLGFSTEAIERMTSAPPTSMHWIDWTDAAHGIAFAPRPTTTGSPLDAPAQPIPAPKAKPRPAATD